MAQAGQSVRDQIRALTVGAKVQFKSQIFTYQGLDVEFRQPSLKDRKLLMEKARGKGGEFDLIEFLVWSVIANSFVPGTNEKIFEETDYPVMMGQTSGSFVDQFGAQIADLLNVDSDPKG